MYLIWALGCQESGLKSTRSKQRTGKILLRLESLVESLDQYPGSKCSILAIWAQSFRKPMLDLKSAPSKQITGKISLRLESLYFLTQNAKNLGTWARSLKKKPDFHNFESLKFWDVLAGFGLFKLDPGFSKYDISTCFEVLMEEEHSISWSFLHCCSLMYKIKDSLQ